MKIGIYIDEMYPFFSIVSTESAADKLIEVDDETFNRWKDAFETFGKVQHELAEKLNIDDFYGDEYEIDKEEEGELVTLEQL